MRVGRKIGSLLLLLQTKKDVCVCVGMEASSLMAASSSIMGRAASASRHAITGAMACLVRADVG